MTKAEKIELAASKAAKAVAASPQQPVSQDAKHRPLTTLRNADCSASVWARDRNIRGLTRRFYSVTFERSYRDAMGQYRYTRSFSPDDLGALISLCQQASEYIRAFSYAPPEEPPQA